MMRRQKITLLSGLLFTSSLYASPLIEFHKQRINDSDGVIGNMLVENKNRLVIYPYEANYLLYSYTNNINTQGINSYHWAQDAKNDEAKFQMSIAFPLLKNILGPGSLLGVSYTQRSFWQVFNTYATSPFRETNYEPQIFLGWDIQYPLLGFNIEELELCFNHQSNGNP